MLPPVPTVRSSRTIALAAQLPTSAGEKLRHASTTNVRDGMRHHKDARSGVGSTRADNPNRAGNRLGDRRGSLGGTRSGGDISDGSVLPGSMLHRSILDGSMPGALGNRRRTPTSRSM